MPGLIGRCGGGGSALIVTDGTHTVNPTTEIDFTAGAVVTDLGGGIAGVAIVPPTDLEVIAGTIVHPAGAVTWGHSGGATLFDYTIATDPTPLVEGTYAFSGVPSSSHVPGAGQYVRLGFVFALAAGTFLGGSWANINYGGGQLDWGALGGTAHMTTSDSFNASGAATDPNYNVSVFLLAQRLA